jgi:YD repeat-containing protein
MVYSYDDDDVNVDGTPVRPKLITKVTCYPAGQDPASATAIGRSASLTYDERQRLTSITDAEGLTTSFSYVGTTSTISTMTTLGLPRFGGHPEGRRVE